MYIKQPNASNGTGAKIHLLPPFLLGFSDVTNVRIAKLFLKSKSSVIVGGVETVASISGMQELFSFYSCIHTLLWLPKNPASSIERC